MQISRLIDKQTETIVSTYEHHFIEQYYKNSENIFF